MHAPASMNPTRDPGRIVFLQPSAPAKPPEGAACNGCGVCCLAEPCPAGVLLTRSRRGPCAVLRWDAASALYRCGLLQDDHPEAAGLGTPVGSALGTAWRAIARRWIAAGRGCDCSLEVMAPARQDEAPPSDMRRD
jgi:hypothetical protein